MGTRFHLGLDVGSVSANVALLDQAGELMEESYTRIQGQPWECVQGLLIDLIDRYGYDAIISVSLTGSAAKIMAEVMNGRFVNETIAHCRAVVKYHPQAKTVIDMGGEDSKLMIMSGDGRASIEDFAMNSACAAGTGSFLDQQANRLGFSIEEFSQQALKSKNPPRVAGRCSVFAKTDMIHLQQEATPDYDIVAGLCYALVRNLKSNIARGKDLKPPVCFQGGVAANKGVCRALADIAGLEDGQLIVPEYFASMGAIGAALITLDDWNGQSKFSGLDLLDKFKDEVKNRSVETGRLEPLTLGDHHVNKCAHTAELHGEDRIPVYLGIDVGSISTNVVLIDEHHNLVVKEYLMTAGRPLEAVKQGLRLVGDAFSDRVEVLGAATTGSGRYLTGEFVGADVVRNEITAQATASADIDPQVDTIFEIGGQDSKYIRLKNGAIVDFMMNKVCAAGTGSFLEEQAEKLNLSIKEEFGARALSSNCPVGMGERCTVFMESDIVHHQQQGVNLDDIASGLSYSIVHNYLNKVVEDRQVGDHIFYQGATANNKGIVAAFEKVTGKPIHVPPHNDVTGAIGAAILARRERTWKRSQFKGFGVASTGYDIKPFGCTKCANRCEIRKVSFEGVDRPLFYGSRCERYDVDTQKKNSGIPDLFALRESWLMGDEGDWEPQGKIRGEIGLPRTMFFRDLMPLFRTFLKELGFRTVVSDLSNKSMIHRGVECVSAETCFPIKVAHGHILDLADKGVRRILMPSLLNLEASNTRPGRNQVCPLASTLAYCSRSAIDFDGLGIELIQPVLRFGEGNRLAGATMKDLAQQVGAPSRLVNAAYERATHAQSRFEARKLAKGRQILDDLGPDGLAMIFVGRPYNAFDAGVNLGLHRKLRDLGVVSIPMDFLDLEAVEDLNGISDLFWRYGQKIMSAAKIIKADPRLQAVYVTNFGCGPDSFLIHFFRDYMKGRPYLEIEIDEHSADVGAMTRLEAFLDSIKNVPLNQMTTSPPSRVTPRLDRQKRRLIYIPSMTDHALPFAAVFRSFDIEAYAMPESDQETLKWGRKFTSGKECYPCILTTGDLVKLLKSNGRDSERVAFFMPTGEGPCRFGCYHRFQRMVLDELGYDNVPIYAPSQGGNLYNHLNLFTELPDDFNRKAWETIVATDVLQKALREYRPYETESGQTDMVYQNCLQDLIDGVENRRPVAEILPELADQFTAIATIDRGSKPTVGVIGEIYTRTNRFANSEVVRQLEGLGAQCWVTPFSEWVLYVNHISIDEAKRQRAWKRLLGLKLTDRVQRKIEHQLLATFRHVVKNLYEPTVSLTMERSRPYVDPSFTGGEVCLSIGKTTDFFNKGASGVLNIIPFSCMPGMIVHAVMKRYREDNGNVPFMTMACDGQEQTNLKSRLEAFMYQVENNR